MTPERRRGTQTAGRRTRKQRAVMATDSDWARVRERAEVAERTVSDYVIESLTAPPPEPAMDIADLVRRVQRVERLVQVLYEVEVQRLGQHGDDTVFETLKRRADAAVEREQDLG